jgi:hypothetical protein
MTSLTRHAACLLLRQFENGTIKESAMPSAATLTATSERRRTVRHSCDQDATPPSVRLGDALRSATIQNLCREGIAVVVDEEMEPNTRLPIQLFNQSRDCWYLKVMRVIYATPHSDGGWQVGGTFLRPLTQNEVNEMVCPAVV